MPNGKNHSIKINTIVCGGTSEFGNYNDEVYIIMAPPDKSGRTQGW